MCHGLGWVFSSKLWDGLLISLIGRNSLTRSTAYGLGSSLNEKCELVTLLRGSVPWEEASSFVYLIISEPAVGSSLLGQVGVINLLINGFVGRPIVFSVAPNFGPFYFSDLINDQMGIVETAGTRNPAPIVINLLEAEFQLEMIHVDQLEIRRMFPLSCS